MKILTDVIDAASDGAVSPETALLKARVLASRLRNAELAAWVRSELEGYGSDAVPEYRRIGVRFRGQAKGFEVGHLVTRPEDIPVSVLPENLRDQFRCRSVTQSIRSLQSLLAADDGIVMIQVPQECLALVNNGKVLRGAQFTRLWLEIGKAQVEDVIAAVRTRLLEFALDMEASLADVKADPDGPPPTVPDSVVQRSIINNIYGGAVNLSVESLGVTQQASSVARGDWGSLRALLEALGVEAADRDSLKDAVDAEPAVTDKSLGPRVTSWLGRMATRVATGAGKVVSGTALESMTKAVLRYYGIHS